jgi:hypothetical protein
MIRNSNAQIEVPNGTGSRLLSATANLRYIASALSSMVRQPADRRRTLPV